MKRYLTKGTIIVFGAAFILRFLLFLFFKTHDVWSFSRPWDCINYVTAAKNLIFNHILCEQNVSPLYHGVFRTPVYPAFIAIIYYLSGLSNSAVVLVQVLLGSITCAALYNLALKFAPQRFAAAAAIFLAFDIVSIKSTCELLSETLFTFLLIVFVMCFIKFLEADRTSYLIISGITAALGALERPILFYVWVAVLPVFIYNYRKTLKKAAFKYITFLLAFFMLTAPWIIRNVSVGYNGFAAVQEVNIFSFKAGWIEARLKGIKDINYVDFDGQFKKAGETLKARGITNTPYSRIKIYKELGTKTVFSHPFLLIKYQAIFTSKVFTSPGIGPIIIEIESALKKGLPPYIRKPAVLGYYLLLAITYCTFLLGIINKKTWKNPKQAFFILIIFLYLTALSGELGGESRFRIPLMPLMLIFSASGFDYIEAICKKIFLNKKLGSESV